jgi:hypothetical protein
MVSLASENIPSLVKQTMPSVVLIKTYDSQGNDLGLGSGFIISKEGDVVTCYHVMRGFSKAVVNTSDGKEFQVKNITAINKSNDLVRMSLSTTDHNFTNLGLNTTTPQVGQEVIAIGGPLGLENTVSQGIVSAIRENKTQITAPISPGSSGGPVLNMNGEVIGIVSSQMIEGQNLNFAIPACLISTMQSASAEQINELRSIEESQYISKEEIHKIITRSVEQIIELTDPLNFVNHAECSIFSNNSMLVKIYLVDGVDPTKLIYGGCDFPKSAISGYILAINMDPSIEDMIVQIGNSTGIKCSMRSYRPQVSGTSLADSKINDSPGGPYRKIYSQIVYTLAAKLLTTMKPVIGVVRVSGKIIPVKAY